MSIFDKIAKNLTTSSNNTNTSSTKKTSPATSYLSSNEKPVTWQCRYCGRRTGMYGNRIPRSEICKARKSVNGRPNYCDWRKLG